MDVRSLDPIFDERLLHEAWTWTRDAPEWFRQADRLFGFAEFTGYHDRAFDDDVVDFGVFDGQLVATIRLTERAKGVLECDLSARRGADAEKIALCAHRLRDELFSAGVREIFALVYARNRGVIHLCEMAGLARDGVRIFKGQVRGRVAEWVRLSCTRERHDEGTETSADAVSAMGCGPSAAP